MSKGEYIFALDDDDMIFGDDIFDSLYKNIIEDNYDILAFKAVNSKSYSEKIRKIKDSYSYNFPNNLIVHQPELSKFIHMYGILHLISSSTASITQPINNKFFGELFLIDIIFDFSKNTEDKKYSAFAALYTMKIYYKYKSTINKSNLTYFNSIVLKIINSKHICIDIKYKLSLSFGNFLSRN